MKRWSIAAAVKPSRLSVRPAVLSGLAVVASLNWASAAAQAAGQPTPGWYVAATGNELTRASLALKLERRANMTIFQVTGLLGNPGNTKSQFPLSGAYAPATGRLTAKWNATHGKKRTELPIDGTYDADKDAFDVSVAFVTAGGAGRATFHCVRSKKKGKEADLTGKWLVKKEGWVMHLTQTGDAVTGTYSGGSGKSRVSGSINGTFDGTTLKGTYVHHVTGGSWNGTVTGTLTDEDTLSGLWKEKKHGMSEQVTAKRAR